MLKRIVAKVRRIKGRLSRSFSAKQEVSVSGLQPDEKMFKESIEEECTRALAKVRKRLPKARMGIHVKSSLRGKGKRFEVKGTLYLDKRTFYASASDRELYGALTRVLYEFQEESRRAKKVVK